MPILISFQSALKQKYNTKLAAAMYISYKIKQPMPSSEFYKMLGFKAN
jgi:hypothetical protein